MTGFSGAPLVEAPAGRHPTVLVGDRADALQREALIGRRAGAACLFSRTADPVGRSDGITERVCAAQTSANDRAGPASRDVGGDAPSAAICLERSSADPPSHATFTVETWCTRKIGLSAHLVLARQTLLTGWPEASWCDDPAATTFRNGTAAEAGVRKAPGFAKLKVLCGCPNGLVRDTNARARRRQTAAPDAVARLEARLADRDSRRKDAIARRRASAPGRGRRQRIQTGDRCCTIERLSVPVNGLPDGRLAELHVVDLAVEAPFDAVVPVLAPQFEAAARLAVPFAEVLDGRRFGWRFIRH